MIGGNVHKIEISYKKRTKNHESLQHLPETFPVFLPVGAGCDSHSTAEHLGEVVIITDSHRLGNGRNGHITFDQKTFCRVDPLIDDDMGNGLPPRELLRQQTEFGSADMQMG